MYTHTHILSLPDLAVDEAGSTGHVGSPLRGLAATVNDALSS